MILSSALQIGANSLSMKNINICFSGLFTYPRLDFNINQMACAPIPFGKLFKWKHLYRTLFQNRFCFGTFQLLLIVFNLFIFATHGPKPSELMNHRHDLSFHFI